VVVDEASSRDLIHIGVYFAIKLLKEECFQDIEANEEVDDENNADNESAERCEDRDRLERYTVNMRTLFEGSTGDDGVIVKFPWEDGGFHDRIGLQDVEEPVG
jgi:hypothetical protein